VWAFRRPAVVRGSGVLACISPPAPQQLALWLAPPKHSHPTPTRLCCFSACPFCCRVVWKQSRPVKTTPLRHASSPVRRPGQRAPPPVRFGSFLGFNAQLCPPPAHPSIAAPLGRAPRVLPCSLSTKTIWLWCRSWMRSSLPRFGKRSTCLTPTAVVCVCTSALFAPSKAARHPNPFLCTKPRALLLCTISASYSYVDGCTMVAGPTAGAAVPCSLLAQHQGTPLSPGHPDTHGPMSSSPPPRPAPPPPLPQAPLMPRS
jgi:hypothetical protein